jgi:ABC-type antimicrobial peptide transport system permease subunit
VLRLLAAVWPVARKLGLAYAVFILVFMLPPLAAGGLGLVAMLASYLPALRASRLEPTEALRDE